MIKKSLIDMMLNIDDKNKEFKDVIDRKRNIIYNYDKTILNNKKIINPKNFNFSSQFEIIIDNIKYSGLFIDGGNKKLYVTFPAAQDDKRDKKILPRWSYYNFLDGSLLIINDPMKDKYQNLEIGWYYGNSNFCYIDIAVKLIKLIIKNKDIKQDDVVFIGSSCGGYAAIMCAISLPNTVSISINPQLYIQNYPYAKEFSRITGINLNDEDIQNRNNIVKKIRYESQSKHIIISNLSSRHDFYDHIKPFCDQYNINIQYGLNKVTDNILIWIYEADGTPSAHVAMETKYLYMFIDYISERFKDQDLNIKEITRIVLLINEFWYDLYQHKYKIYQLMNQRQLKIQSIPINNRLLTNNIYKQMVSIYIAETKFGHNHRKFIIDKQNTLFSVMIEGIVFTKDIKTFSIALYDRTQEIIKVFNYNINNDNKYILNFTTGDDINGIYLLIYTGVKGKANNISCHIDKITFYAESTNV